jgi:hypothetical protein
LGCDQTDYISPNRDLTSPDPLKMPSRFERTVIVRRKDKAIEDARDVALTRSTTDHIQLSLFCDTSRALDHPVAQDHGAIAVAYKAWIPGTFSRDDRRPTFEVAYPVNPLVDSGLGELMAVAESLYIASQEVEKIKRIPEFRGRTARVRIFNDNRFNLEYLEGTRRFPKPVHTLVKPVLEKIGAQSRRLARTKGVRVKLYLHWLPGHGHGVQIPNTTSWPSPVSLGKVSCVCTIHSKDAYARGGVFLWLRASTCRQERCQNAWAAHHSRGQRLFRCLRNSELFKQKERDDNS